MPLPIDIPGAVLFVLKDLLSYSKAKTPGAAMYADRYVDDFMARYPELIKPGDVEAPEPPAADAIDAEVDGLIEGGEV